MAQSVTGFRHRIVRVWPAYKNDTCEKALIPASRNLIPMINGWSLAIVFSGDDGLRCIGEKAFGQGVRKVGDCC